MKYGFNDHDWKKDLRYGGRLTDAILKFNREGFQSFMKRKTVSEMEKFAINALYEMVCMMKDHVDEIEKKA